MGVPMMKFPEALRLYEHLLWSSEADCVIELGCLHGGSTLWFRDRLETMRKYRKSSKPPRVFAIDKSIDSARSHIAKADPAYEETITLIPGDLQSPQTFSTLENLLPQGTRCLIVEDSAHIFDTTFVALQNFSNLVPKGCFFVVEDGYLDTDLRKQFFPAELGWDGVVFGGMIDAIQKWQATDQGKKFKVRSDWELYGLSTTPQGILERIEV